MKPMYNGEDPRALAAYSQAEAARYLGLPRATLHGWTAGRDRLIEPVEDEYLSFNNVVEAYVLSALRREHKLKMGVIRRALDFVRAQMKVERPLLQRTFETDGVDLFVAELDRLVNASQHGQIASRVLIADHLSRIERDERGLAAKLFPVVRSLSPDGLIASMPRHIVIDPSVQFGRPVIAGTRIRVAAVASRYESGESISALSVDFACPIEAIEEAIRAGNRMRVAA